MIVFNTGSFWFGLHQLRGRVGRGNFQELLSGKQCEAAHEKNEPKTRCASCRAYRVQIRGGVNRSTVTTETASLGSFFVRRFTQAESESLSPERTTTS